MPNISPSTLIKWGAIGLVLLIVVCCVGLALVVGAFNSINGCDPSSAAVLAGDIKLGSGPYSDRYFSQFSSQLVAQKKANAALIIKIGQSEGFTSVVPVEAAIGAALDESGMLNLPGGDRDSLGLFQQRPSVGAWGTAAQIMDTTHATEAFYNALKRNAPNYAGMSLINIAIAVQNPSVSAYESSWSRNNWAYIAQELVTGTSSATTSGGTQNAVSVCNSSNASVVLPLKPGYSVTTPFDDTAADYVGIKPHSGIDLSDYPGGSLGKPVYAIMAGTVVASGKGMGCSGDNEVLIRQADGVDSVYLHMNGSDIIAGVGDVVKAGQQIGAIGSCGFSTGPHLHFAIMLTTGTAPWLLSLLEVHQFGDTWLDPVGYMAHYGVTLVPNK